MLLLVWEAGTTSNPGLVKANPKLSPIAGQYFIPFKYHKTKNHPKRDSAFLQVLRSGGSSGETCCLAGLSPRQGPKTRQGQSPLAKDRAVGMAGKEQGLVRGRGGEEPETSVSSCWPSSVRADGCYYPKRCSEIFQPQLIALSDTIWEITISLGWAACQENMTERAIRRVLCGEGNGVTADRDVTSSTLSKHRVATPNLEQWLGMG